MLNHLLCCCIAVALSGCSNVETKALNLLHLIAHTQSCCTASQSLAAVVQGNLVCII